MTDSFFLTSIVTPLSVYSPPPGVAKVAHGLDLARLSSFSAFVLSRKCAKTEKAREVKRQDSKKPLPSSRSRPPFFRPGPSERRHERDDDRSSGEPLSTPRLHHAVLRAEPRHHRGPPQAVPECLPHVLRGGQVPRQQGGERDARFIIFRHCLMVGRVKYVK